MQFMFGIRKIKDQKSVSYKDSKFKQFHRKSGLKINIPVSNTPSNRGLNMFMNSLKFKADQGKI